MSAASQTVRRRVIYSGRVQGVFFRATSEEIAQGYAVTGFVRNLPDGTVELVAQGAPDQVAAFLAAVEERYRGNITNTQVTEQSPEADERGFTVRG